MQHSRINPSLQHLQKLATGNESYKKKHARGDSKNNLNQLLLQNSWGRELICSWNEYGSINKTYGYAVQRRITSLGIFFRFSSFFAST